MRVKGKRGLAVCMAALLALSGLKVSAEEPVQPEEIAAEVASAVFGGDAEGEFVGSVSDGDMEEPGGEVETEVPEEVVGIAAEEQEVFYAVGNIASGKDGDITWVIDADGKLTVTGTGDFWHSAWDSYRNRITSAEINVSGMTDASRLFSGCCNLTSLDVSGFDTSQVTDMGDMFADCCNLTSLDVSGFDTSQVTDMSSMFLGCSSLTSLDVSGFDTNKVTDMSQMFYDCSSLTSLDVSGFNTGKVWRMEGMFHCCKSLTNLDISRFDTGKVTNMADMFKNCSNLTSLDVSGFDTSKVTDMTWMFQGCSSLTSLDVSGFDTSKVTSMSGMLERCSSLTNLDLSSFDTSEVLSINNMFSGCSNLTSLDLSSFDTSKVTGGVQSMFYNCSSLTSLDVSSFDTSNMTYMGLMFYNCSSLTSLDVSRFDTSEVLSMDGMFSGCRNLTGLDVSGFDTSKVTTTGGMFGGCSSLTSLDISGFDTSKVTDMRGMFGGCSSLTSLDVSRFDTGKAMYMGGMFSGCSGLTSLNVSGFDTSKVTDMRSMFSSCSSLTSLDISGFDTSKVTDMRSMFSSCSSLTSLDISGFDTDKVESMGMWEMFIDCTNLKTIKTPHTMGTETAILPATFLAPNGTETQVLSKEFCNTTLTRKELPKPAPVKFTVVGVVGGRNVTFNNDTEGTVIYYSSKTSALTTNDACVNPGETVLFENFYGTIYAKAYADGQWSNVSRLVLKIPVVNKPTITCKDGVVTIKTTTPNSYIYYTTDGSTPSPTNGKMLSKSGGSFTVPANCTVKAIAVRSCFTNSEIASAKVTARKLGAPSFAVKGVIGGREVTFNTTETKGEIYYSFTSSNITTKDLHVKPGEKVLFQNYYGTVYARTYVNGQWSNVSRLVLRIPVVNKPTITAAGSGKVKISTSTPNCAIYYTTDGSTPSPTHGTRINSSSSVIAVESGKTVRAIAVRSCFTNSEVTAYIQK